jgi:VCBS repeat-containing protein
MPGSRQPPVRRRDRCGHASVTVVTDIYSVPPHTIVGPRSEPSLQPSTPTSPANGSPANGSVTVDAAGNDTYTPTDIARHNAAAPDMPASVTQDSFTVTTDGHTPETVTVAVSPQNDPPAPGTPTVGTPDPITGVVA